MIRYVTAIMFLALVISCNNEASTDKKQSNETATPPQQWFETDTLLVWDCTAEDRSRKKIFAPRDSVNVPQALINGINKTYAEVKLSFDHISNDTLYVSIPKAEWLTDRAGNAGAEQYLTFAALNLLETKGINHVDFVFASGAHARAATWTDLDFTDWKTDTTSVK
ncbi:MAG: hypothetical protein ABL872_06680 [Lacibacter sp.]